MNSETRRRRFLQLAGLSTALSLAGCQALQNDDGDAGPTTATANGTATVTVAVRPDQAILEQRREQIRSELQAGTISRYEAQQQLQTVQEELRSDAVAAFIERASSNSELSIVEAIDRLGVILVSGTPRVLIGVLSAEAVNALLPKAAFQQVKAQATPDRTTATPE